MEHCRKFSAEEQSTEHPGFGYPSLIEQLRHIIGAEDYWFSVLQGNWDIEDHAAACNTVAELEERRGIVANQTTDYLMNITDQDLDKLDEYATWPDATLRELLPSMVIMRVISHHIHHRGQAVAICRILRNPAPTMDFPVAPPV